MAETGSSDENLEDLDNVPLSCLPGMQPSSTDFEIQNGYTEDTVVASAINYTNFDEDDGSNVSVSETAATDDDEDSDNEAIVPVAMPDEMPIDIPAQDEESKPNPDSWPTLEILPGGVIKPAIDNDDNNLEVKPKIEDEINEMMYACAKCPQRFKFLFCLVKHVKWHEDEKKRDEGSDLSKLNELEKHLLAIKSERLEIVKKYRKKKLVIMQRMARAIGELRDINGFRDK